MAITALPVEQIIEEAVLVRLDGPELQTALAGKGRDTTTANELAQQVASDSECRELTNPCRRSTYGSAMRFLGRREPSKMLISGHRSEYLVGVEHYQGTLTGRAIGAPLTVELVADVNNPHDSNAVVGHIDGRVAGYLRRDVASKYRAPIMLAREHGFRLVVQTMVQKREDGLMRPGWLDIPSPDALSRWLALPEDERARGFDFPAGNSPATPRSQGRPL